MWGEYLSLFCQSVIKRKVFLLQNTYLSYLPWTCSWHIQFYYVFFLYLQKASIMWQQYIIHLSQSPAKFCRRKPWCARACTDAGYTCVPRSCRRSIGGGRGSHRSAQCMEANLCHCSGDPSAPRHQGVKFKLLLQPGNSIIWGKDMSLWHILAVFLV